MNIRNIKREAILKYFRSYELYSTKDRPGLFPVCRTWLYQAIKEGRFPGPSMLLSERVPVWSEIVISDYIKNKEKTA